jgi:hypothetical protein
VLRTLKRQYLLVQFSLDILVMNLGSWAETATWSDIVTKIEREKQQVHIAIV